MALLILEPGDICEVQNVNEAGDMAGFVVIILRRETSKSWKVEKYPIPDGEHIVEDKYLDLKTSV